MCRQATCRQIESLHIVAVNIIAILSKRLRKTVEFIQRAFTYMASIYPWVSVEMACMH